MPEAVIKLSVVSSVSFPMLNRDDQVYMRGTSLAVSSTPLTACNCGGDSLYLRLDYEDGMLVQTEAVCWVCADNLMLVAYEAADMCKEGGEQTVIEQIILDQCDCYDCNGDGICNGSFEITTIEMDD